MPAKKLILSFDTKDASGRTYKLNVFQAQVDVSNFDDGEASIPGSTSIRTASGDVVMKTGDREYLIVPKSIKLTSTDPKAF